MPEILAIQEAQIRRITVLSQPWANNSRDPIAKKLITEKSWRGDLSDKSTCLASMRA
jgi:hypothetical protein